MSTVMLAEADAETRFRLRAQRGVGGDAPGLELPEKAAGRDTAGWIPATRILGY